MDSLKQEAFNIYGTKNPAKHDVIEHMRSTLSEEEFFGAMKIVKEFQKFYVLPCGHQAGDWVKIYFGPGMSSDNAKVVKVHLSGFTTFYDIDVFFEENNTKYQHRFYNVSSHCVHRVDKLSNYKDYVIVYDK